MRKVIQPVISTATAERFVTAAGEPRPYAFLQSLVQQNESSSMCRKHGVMKVQHTYGPQLQVCPECFPAEVLV